MGEHRFRRIGGGRSFVPSLVATFLGSALIVFGGLTVSATSALAQSSDVQPSDSSTCSTDPVLIELGGVIDNGATATVPYTISGCVGSDRLHIHQNLLASPTAGSDSEHQSNYNFDITVDSPTEQTVPLLDGVAGKCWIQFDYSTARERHGAFLRTPTCPTETPTPPPTSSLPPSSSSAPSTSTVPSTHPVPSSSAATSTSVVPHSSQPAPQVTSSAVVPVVASVAPSQIGPIPHTGFSGTVQVRQIHPYAWTVVVGGALLLLGLTDLVRRLLRRRADMA
jgi:hypothetical protein